MKQILFKNLESEVNDILIIFIQVNVNLLNILTLKCQHQKVFKISKDLFPIGPTVPN